MNGSYRFIVIRADGIVRTYCWWGSGDANGSHELLIISANGIIRLTFNGTLDTQMARSGSLLRAWPDVHIIVWAHLIRGGQLRMVSCGPIFGGTTMEMRMALFFLNSFSCT